MRGPPIPPMAHRPKFSRVKQSWRPALVLQERDIDFIRAAEEFRLLSTPQYFLLFPTESRAAIYRRLQTLYHHAYLDRLKGDPSAPMVYALGTRGAGPIWSSLLLSVKGFPYTTA